MPRFQLRSFVVEGFVFCSAARPKWLLLILALWLWGLVGRASAAEQKVSAMLQTVDQFVAQGPFHADWQSLENYRVPEWYLDAKFGIFIHWGVYSVPAFGNEWYPRNMYKQDTPEFKHHLATYGPQAQFGYKDFIPRFSAEHFDPRHWAELFRKSGARYIVPVAEHHDGFPMYDCSLTDWCAAKIGPKRDILGELARAVRAEGLHLGASSHRAEHWWFYDQGMTFDSDVRDPRYGGLYGPAQPEKGPAPNVDFLDDWLARTSEIVQKYQPELIWFDWWIEQPVFKPYLQRFAAFYYNWGVQNGRGVAINYKLKSFPEKTAVWDIERGQLAAIRPFFWQTDTSVSKNSWGYVQPQDYKTAGAIVGDLVDIVSKNGSLLLNIGPRPDGTIPEAEEQILLEIGRWLQVNGEAIYGSRPWKVFGEGPTQVVEGSFNDTKRQPFTSADLRFTSKGSTVYAIALAWPADRKLLIKSLASSSPFRVGKIRNVQLLGSAAELRWDSAAEGLAVELPAEKPCDHAYVLKISIP